VKLSAAVIGDPVVTGEIKTQCRDKAMTTLEKVFPENRKNK
jgi:hypothetical protein